MTTTPIPTSPATSSETTPGAPLDVLVIGAGQAGLALAWHLNRRGARYLLIDAAPEIGHSWRTRWDSLRLFTPAQYDTLPGTPFPAKPDTHPTKDQVADYLATYAETHASRSSPAPVTRLAHGDRLFTAHTTRGVFVARQVVIATGAFHQPSIPAIDVRLRLSRPAAAQQQLPQPRRTTLRRPGPRGRCRELRAADRGRDTYRPAHW